MRYNLAQLLKEPTGSSRQYQLDESFASPDSFAEATRGPVNFLRTHRGVLATATLQVRSTLVCSRCLGNYCHSSTLSIEEEFFPTVSIQTGQTQLVPVEADDNALIDRNHVLDLGEIIREYVVTDTPMKPLCSRECMGLCQWCGADLNLKGCDCHDSPEDGRWWALSGLMKHGCSTK